MTIRIPVNFNLPALTRAVRRERAIATGQLKGYRMPGKVQPPAKGKGAAYRRRQKHQGR